MRIAITQNNIHVVLCQYRDWPMPVPFILDANAATPSWFGLLPWAASSYRERQVIRMTERQKRFVDYYIQSGNVTDAARKAGYKNPEKYGNENMGKHGVREAIAERLQQLQSERIADAEEVLTYLTAAMRGQISEEVIVIEGTGNGESSARVETKQLSAATRTKAAELLAKRYGLLLDKKELTGAGGSALTVRWMKSPDEKVTQ